MAAGELILPGKLGSPEGLLVDDIRLDPRIKKMMANMPEGSPADGMPQLNVSSSYADSLRWVGEMENMLASQDQAVSASMPDFPGVSSRKEVIRGVDQNDIDLHIEEPRGELRSQDEIPCIVHLHGGGMVMTTAQASTSRRWRRSLAQQGVIVVGVEFRNGGGALGNHPFPAGLTDCASAVRWVHEHRSELGISSIVVTGESGGGNLAVATAVKANLEGWVNEIDGVFAIAPMIFGYYGTVPPELLSWRENEGYEGTLAMTRAMARVYDPESKHEYDPMAWPYHALNKHLEGLPPHIITNYELDLIRDDGVFFARKLQAAGVSAISRTITGATHVVDLVMPDLFPELLDETINSLVGFARRLGDVHG